MLQYVRTGKHYDTQSIKHAAQGDSRKQIGKQWVIIFDLLTDALPGANVVHESLSAPLWTVNNMSQPQSYKYFYSAEITKCFVGVSFHFLSHQCESIGLSNLFISAYSLLWQKWTCSCKCSGTGADFMAY